MAEESSPNEEITFRMIYPSFAQIKEEENVESSNRNNDNEGDDNDDEPLFPPAASSMPVIQGGSYLREASLTEDVDEFCNHFKRVLAEYIRNAYRLFREIYHSPNSGCLSTSLAEDVMSLLWLQQNILSEYMDKHPDRKDCIVNIYSSVFQELHSAQRNLLPLCFISLEHCCAAANDFFRLANKLEVFCESLPQEAKNHGMEFVAHSSQDAIYAAERIQVFFIRSVNQTTIPVNFFSPAWENDWTHNEVMIELLKILDQVLRQAESYLDNKLLYSKVLISSCKAVVCFYIRCLVEKADAVCRKKRRGSGIGRDAIAKPFCYAHRALLRMNHDIILLRQYFAEKVGETNVALSRFLQNEMRTLEVIYECLSISNDDLDSLEGMVVVIHKRTGADALVTRYFVGDLWALVMDQEGQNKKERLRMVMANLEPDLEMISNGIRECSATTKAQTDLQFLRIDDMLRGIYEDRIAQGVLPLCWTCLPKVESMDGSGKLVVENVRKMTRRWTGPPNKNTPTQRTNQVEYQSLGFS